MVFAFFISIQFNSFFLSLSLSHVSVCSQKQRFFVQTNDLLYMHGCGWAKSNICCFAIYVFNQLCGPVFFVIFLNRIPNHDNATHPFNNRQSPNSVTIGREVIQFFHIKYSYAIWIAREQYYATKYSFYSFIYFFYGKSIIKHYIYSKWNNYCRIQWELFVIIDSIKLNIQKLNRLQVLFTQFSLSKHF